jgi:hypothetical protein
LFWSFFNNRVNLTLSGPGSIAQLVERCLCKADVSGSSPLTSTRLLILFYIKIRRNSFSVFKLPGFLISDQMKKSLRWIPRHLETMKGVETNEMLRGAGNKL